MSKDKMQWGVIGFLLALAVGALVFGLTPYATHRAPRVCVQAS